MKTGIKSPITADMIDLYRLEKEDELVIQSIWKYIESQVQDVGVTSTWEWVSTWIEHYADVVEFCFIVGVFEGKPCGVTIVTRETNRKLPLPVKSFHIGTNGEPYKDQVQMINNQVLTTSEARSAFYEALIHVLTRNFPWDEIVFDDYNSSDANVIHDLLEKREYNFTVAPKTCKYFDLSIPRAKEKDILANLSSDTRYWIRRSMKILGNDFTVEWADNVDQAFDIFNEMAVLFQEKWTRQGQRGIFASKRYVSFHQTLIAKLLSQNRIILFRVSSKEYGTIGCLYMFVDNGVAYGYQLGLRDFSQMNFGDINPNRIKGGFILHTLCMQECLNRGLRAYNFSTGDYSYKKELTNKEEEVSTISIRKNITPYMRESVIKLHNKLMENRRASFFLRPFKMLF